MTDVKPKVGKGLTEREQPWAVRGVSKEAQSKAKGAAQIAGLPLGKWLDRVIVEAAHGQVSSRKEVGSTEQQLVAQTLKTMAETLERTNQRLDAIQSAQTVSFWERFLGRRGATP